MPEHKADPAMPEPGPAELPPVPEPVDAFARLTTPVAELLLTAVARQQDFQLRAQEHAAGAVERLLAGRPGGADGP
jgi:hypothetical protein